MAKQKKAIDPIHVDGKEIVMISDPSKRIPKFSSQVYFGKAKDMIVMTFVFKDNPEQEENVVIERIMVSIDHARSISKAIDNLLRKEEKK